MAVAGTVRGSSITLSPNRGISPLASDTPLAKLRPLRSISAEIPLYGDRRVVRILDADLGQESRFQARPGNRLEAGQVHTDRLVLAKPGTRGQRCAHESDERGPAH